MNRCDEGFNDDVYRRLDPAFLAEVGRRAGLPGSSAEQRAQTKAATPELRQIATLFDLEMSSGGLNGLLFGECLASALDVHLLRGCSVQRPALAAMRGTLTPRQLRTRLREARLVSDLSLEEIALEVGYCPDVDLAKFRYNGGSILPSFEEGSVGGLDDPSRHAEDECRGVVSGPDGSRLSLTLGNGRSLPVTVAPGAVVFGGGLESATGLANGQTVEALGKLDIASGRFVASEIRNASLAEGEIEPSRAQANGLALRSARDGSDGTIALGTARLTRFRPSQTQVEVRTTDATTTVVERGGANVSSSGFYAALAAKPQMCAEGSFDPPANRLVASIVKLE